MKEIPPFVVYWIPPGAPTYENEHTLATGFNDVATAEAFKATVRLFRPGQGHIWLGTKIPDSGIAMRIWQERGVMGDQ